MRLVSIALTLLLTAFLDAQDAAPQRTLDSLVRENRAAIAKAAQSDDPDAYDEAVAHFCRALGEYLEHEARGEEKHETRFQLVFALMSGGKRDAAQKVLAKFDAGKASCVSCGEAAYLASTLSMGKEYEKWIVIALAKPASAVHRMELGVLLMSKLRKPKLGEKLFADALRAARGDEAKARVLWHRARATREREDVSDVAYDAALGEIAKRYPKTRFGAIAHDRLLAMDFKIGGDPLPLTVETTDDKQFSLQAKRGRVALVCFWLPGDPRSAHALPALQKLHDEHATAGLSVLAISLGKKDQAVSEARAHRVTFDQAIARGGMDSDLALRYRVEDSPYCFLVGRKGKIRGMNFVLHDAHGRKQLADAVRLALKSR
jgi:peroxiredoxin